MLLQRQQKIDKVLANRQPDVVLVLEDIHDPHNAGAIFRSCDAFGIQDVYLIWQEEKYYNPKKVGKSSSSSANKWLTFHEYHSSRECFTNLIEQGFTIYATILDSQAESLADVNFCNDKKIALLIGNEHRGISSVAKTMSQKQLYIPMLGMVQSLNVSVAASICLWEISRQKKFSVHPGNTNI